MGKTSKRYALEVRERAVRMVGDHAADHESQWAAIQSITPKIECTAETLRRWVREAKKAAVVLGTDARAEEAARMKAQEREVRELRYAAFIAEAIDGATAPSEAFRAVLEGAARLYAADPERTGCMALEASANASESTARKAACELVDAARAALTARYAELGADVPEERANATIVGMRGLSTEARMGRNTDDLVAAAAVIARR